eukprot:287723-Alexandrium_andersonii.AAC.1
MPDVGLMLAHGWQHENGPPALATAEWQEAVFGGCSRSTHAHGRREGPGRRQHGGRRDSAPR